MPVSEHFREQLEQLMAALPVWFDVLLGFAAIWGVFLWLFGRRIIRPSVTMFGLIAGAVACGIVGRRMGAGNSVVVFIIAGAVGGAIVTWLTFRIWMAALLAIMLASVAPWAVIAWEGIEGPPNPIDDLKDTARQFIEDGVDELAPGSGELAPDGEDAAPGNPFSRIFNGGEADHDATDEQRPALLVRFADAARAGWENLRQWWDELSGTAQALIFTASGVMALTGLLIGLIFPHLGASLAASLAGSAIVLSVVLRLGGKYLSTGDWLPSSPRAALIALGVLTIAGTLIQWTVLRPKADKS